MLCCILYVMESFPKLWAPELNGAALHMFFSHPLNNIVTMKKPSRALVTHATTCRREYVTWTHVFIS